MLKVHTLPKQFNWHIPACSPRNGWTGSERGVYFSVRGFFFIVYTIVINVSIDHNSTVFNEQNVIIRNCIKLRVKMTATI